MLLPVLHYENDFKKTLVKSSSIGHIANPPKICKVPLYRAAQYFGVYVTIMRSL